MKKSQTPPRLETNQVWIENLQNGATTSFQTVEETFAFVFGTLPDEVFVFPTENYYYYRFAAGGIVYAGNLRLAAQDRDTGIIHFAVFTEANQSIEASEIGYKAFGVADGVTVVKQGAFAYSVTYNLKTVLFRLNDLSKVVPPKNIVADGEEYLGPIFDESGIRFFLFYNRRLKVFAYVLDETVPLLDELVTVDKDKPILLGRRTGFAFYKHHHLNRKMLIGVHGANTLVNNYYDGPADQLPENHIKNDNLRKAIVDADPASKDQLDTFGYLATGEGRYLIAPYIQYTDIAELDDYHDCATDPGVTKELYDGCFIASD